jgi:hypothetical protein
MEEKEKADMLKWTRCWENAGTAMEELRRNDLDRVDVQRAIEALDDAFESALEQTPIRPISGLVEMQAWFSKAR